MIIGLEDGCGYNCEDEGWSVESIQKCQKISDFLIALAYFSIPLEILYFVSCSRAFPYRWVLFQFGAFIVLCGLTHFVNVWTYASPNFPVMFALTIFKAFTAFVSCATAITLATLIPQLLRVKVREGFLKNKAMELDRAVGFMKKQEEASWHVRMLTQDIRSSLDRHTILNTTLVELSKVLNLDNCAIWMPSEDGTLMELTHELKRRLLQERIIIPITNPDVMEIKSRKSIVILKPDSALGKASVQQWLFPGPTAAIRIPMLKVSNFSGTPELIDASYAILVVVLPSKGESMWIPQELEIVEVVADQIAVALSHAALLEESQQMRNRLADQNKTLQRARVDAMMASQAHNSFQRVINHQARVLMHCIYALSSILQVENWKIEQQPLVEMLASSSNNLCTAVNNKLDALLFEANTLRLELHSFHFPAMLKVAVRLAKFVCVSKGLQFVTDIDVGIPSHVIGDEKQIMQIISHTVENVSNCIKKGTVSLQVRVQNTDDGSWDQKNPKRRPSMCEGFVNLRFEVRSTVSGLEEAYSSRLPNVLKQDDSCTPSYNGAGLGFDISKQIVQLMHGNMWIEVDSHGVVHIETFIIRLELQKTSSRSDPQLCADQSFDSSAFRGLKVVVADDNTINCAVTERLLQRLGCEVAVTHSGYQCLRKLFESGSGNGTVYQLVLVEVCMADMDGRDVTFLIHEQFSGRNRPLVIALTAHTDKVTLDRCLEMGMDGIIWKPVSLKEMRRELSKIMQKSIRHVSSSTSCG